MLERDPGGPRALKYARRGRHLYYTILLGILAVVQLRAQAAQVEGGFRPFSHAPSRVPYSWDMFAIRIDRCAVGWSPPLWVEGARIGRWRDRSAPVEFDTVYNDARHYEAAARAGCAYRVDPGTVASLECWTGDGGVHEGAIECP